MADWQLWAEWKWLADTKPGKFEHAGIILHISYTRLQFITALRLCTTNVALSQIFHDTFAF